MPNYIKVCKTCMNRPIPFARSARGPGRPPDADGLAIGGSDCSHPVISVLFWLRLRGHIRLNQHAHLRSGSGAGPGPRGGEQSDPGAPGRDAGPRLVSGFFGSANCRRALGAVASEPDRWCASGWAGVSPGGAWPGSGSGRGPVGMVKGTSRSRSELAAKSSERDGCAVMRTGGDGLAAVSDPYGSGRGAWPNPGRGPVAGRRVTRPGPRGPGSLVPPPWGPDPLRSRRPVALLACPSKREVARC